VGRFVGVCAVIVPCLMKAGLVVPMIVTVLIRRGVSSILPDVIVRYSVDRLAGLAFCTAFESWAMLAAATAATASAPASAPWSAVAFGSITVAFGLALLATLLRLTRGHVKMSNVCLAIMTVGAVLMSAVISLYGPSGLISVLWSWSAIIRPAVIWVTITTFGAITAAAAAAATTASITLTISLAITLTAFSLALALPFAGTAVDAFAILVVAHMFDFVQRAITSIERFVALCAGLLAIEAPIHADGGAVGRSDWQQWDGAALNSKVGTLHTVAGLHGDNDAIAAFDIDDEAALGVEDVKRDGRGRQYIDR
jgi:hypothetical protein